jgi:hypothetical protein
VGAGGDPGPVARVWEVLVWALGLVVGFWLS